MTRLVADIGGTNARFALADAAGSLRELRNFRVRDFPGPEEAIRRYLEETAARVRHAVLAVATPVENDEIRFTNSPWRFSRRQLEAALGLERLVVVNDFVAQAIAVAHLPAEDLEPIGGGAALAGRPMVVIGPGTGLGTSVLVPCPEGRRPIATEAGHISLAPETPRELELLRLLWARFPHVSRERVLSGPGIVNLATAVSALDGEARTFRDPAEVVAQAREGSCARCREALSLFSGLLGAYVGDMVLAHGAFAGAYLVGTLLGRLGELFDRDLFRARFEAKGRLQALLERVPVWRVRRTETGLLGASHLAFGEAG